MKKISSLIVVLCALYPVLRAQSYSEYMESVERHNAAWLAEQYNLDIAQAQTEAAKVFNDPELSVSYGNNQDWSLQMGQSVEAELSYGFSLGNVRKARIGVARSEEEITRALLDDWFLNLKAEATVAWIEALQARSLLELKQSSYASMRSVAQADSLRETLGDLGKVDAMQSRLEAQAMWAETLSAEADYRNALSTLSYYAGGMVFDKLPDGPCLIPVPALSCEEMVEYAIDNRADLKAAELSRTLSQRNLALVKATRAPEIELNAGYSYNTEVRNEIAPAPLFHGLTVGVAIPLKFSSLNKGERVAAERAVLQADAAYEAAVRQIETEVRQAYAFWQAAARVANECSDQMRSESASILENRRLAYLQGDSSLLDYFLSVQVYNDTALQCIEAESGLATAAAVLVRALGI